MLMFKNIYIKHFLNIYINYKNMRQLSEYIFEKIEFGQLYEGSDESTKDFTFDCSGFVEDVSKAVGTIDNMSVDGSKVTIHATEGDESSVSGAIDKIKELISSANNSGKRSSDEAFAQKVKSAENTLSSLQEYVAEKDDEGEE